MGKVKQKKISVHAQGGKLRYYFPDSSLKIINLDKGLIWEGQLQLQPSDLSPYYSIKIEYTLGKHPNVYVTSPKPLLLADGEVELPHVYDNEQQRICLYFKPSSEWTANRMIADTIVPWASEWLLHYEFWVLTGEWKGGGIVH